MLINELKEIYDQFLGYTHQERINLAANAGGEVVDYLRAAGCTDEQCCFYFGSLIAIFLGADGKLTASEADLFNQVLGSNFQPEQLVEVVNNCSNQERFDYVNKVTDSMNDENKKKVLWVLLAVMADDGEISEQEEALFAEIFR